jgi:hypothetical protein
MRKPLMTKKTSTPAAPASKECRVIFAAWNSTTAIAASARRY